MADISAELVKELRERTGAGFMDCKRALEEPDGDLEKATAVLRERGPGGRRQEGRPRGPRGPRLELHPHRRPGRRADRGQLRDGLRGHGPTSSSGSSATSRCRSPASPRCTSTPIASRRPTSRPSRPSCWPTRRPQKKPENIRAQIVEGQLKKWYSQVCLYDQPFRDEERTVRDLVTERIATIGENIRVRRFTRYALGEEL